MDNLTTTPPIAASRGAVPEATRSTAPRSSTESARADSPCCASWQESLQAVEVTDNPDGLVRFEQQLTGNVLLRRNFLYETDISGSAPGAGSEIQQHAASRRVQPHGGCQRLSNNVEQPHLLFTESTPVGVKLPVSCTLHERAELDGYGGLPDKGGILHNPSVCASFAGVVPKCQSRKAQQVIGSNTQDVLSNAATIFKGAFAEAVYATEGTPVAVKGVEVAGDMALQRQEEMGSISAPRNGLIPVNDELESCKQQLQEMSRPYEVRASMKALATFTRITLLSSWNAVQQTRLDALWSQKEAFRRANERLSRAVGRMQNSNFSPQSRAQSFDSNALALPSATVQGSCRRKTAQSPQTFSRETFLPALGDGRVTSRPLPPPRPASAASFAANFINLRLDQVMSRSVHRSDVGGVRCERSTGQREGVCERKGRTRDCKNSVDELQPLVRQRCSILPHTSARRSRRENSSSSGAARGSIDCHENRRVSSSAHSCATISSTPRSPHQAARNQLVSQPFVQKRSQVDFLQKNSRRSLPPVPPLDFRGMQQLQKRPPCRPIVTAGGSTSAVVWKDSTSSSRQATPRRGWRPRSSQRRSSSGRCFAAIEGGAYESSAVQSTTSNRTAGWSGCREGRFAKGSVNAGGKRYVRPGDLPRIIRTGNQSSSIEKNETFTQRRTPVTPSALPTVGSKGVSAIERSHCVAPERATSSRGDTPIKFYGAQTCRQRSMREGAERLATFQPLHSRPACAAWRPLISTRSTIGGVGQKERACFSARPSLAQTAMKTPQTWFLDDRIVRLNPAITSFSKNMVPPSATAKDTSMKKLSCRAKRYNQSGEGGPRNGEGSSLVACEESAVLSVEERLAVHVRQCMELLQCTEGSREDDSKTANVSCAASNTTVKASQRPPQKEEEKRGKTCTTANRSLPPVPLSTVVCHDGLCAAEEEDSTLQTCVRKPRDGYWHVIYTCVIKVRGTDFFLDVRFPDAVADDKNCQAARLICSKEQAGVFKVCVRHLLRSTRDLFDSARVLWWQPLPVVCNDEWVPYDEVIRCRAATQIRALRAKYPALAAAALEREHKKTQAAQPESEKQKARTNNGINADGAEQGSVCNDISERRKQKPGFSCSTASQIATKELANFQQTRKTQNFGVASCHRHFVLQYSQGALPKKISSCNGSNTTVRKSERAAVEVKHSPVGRIRRHSTLLLTSARSSEDKAAGKTRAIVDSDENPAASNKNSSLLSKMRPTPPRHYSEWDTVGLLYVGSLNAEQPVAQFKRIFGLCGSTSGEPGGWYVSCAKAKPRCMHLSPSSDMSFLLSKPLKQSSSTSRSSNISESSSTSGSSIASSMSRSHSLATCMSSSMGKRGRRKASESGCSSHAGVTAEAQNTGPPEEHSPHMARYVPHSASHTPSTAQSSLHFSPFAPGHMRLHDTKECSCNSRPSTRTSRDSNTSCNKARSESSDTSSSNTSETTCSNITSSNITMLTKTEESKTAWRKIPECATVASTKRNLPSVQPETAEAAFDRTCQLSLSRKLGLQELFIVKRSDREDGCFPLYHHFSGRYLSAHPTNGLVGMVCANAISAAARAARAVREEIRACCRLTSKLKSTPSTPPLQTSGPGTSPVTRLRKDTQLASSDTHSTSKDRQALYAAPKYAAKHKQTTANEETEDDQPGMTATHEAENTKQAPAKYPSRNGRSYKSEQGRPGCTSSLREAASNSCTSTALFPPSPFFLSRLAHAARVQASQMRGFTGSSGSSSYTEDTCSKSDGVLPFESTSATEKEFVEDGPPRASNPETRGTETATGHTSTTSEHVEEEQERNMDKSIHKHRKRGTVSIAQQGARKLGALIHKRRLQGQYTHLHKPSEILASATHIQPSSTAVMCVQCETAEVGGSCSASASVNGLLGKGSNADDRAQLKAFPVTPSFFELVTVSDLLVQQTVAQILAAVPQPSALSPAFEESGNFPTDVHHLEQRRASVDRRAAEAEASTEASGAEHQTKDGHVALTKSRRRPMTPETHPAPRAEKAEERSSALHLRDTSETSPKSSTDNGKVCVADAKKKRTQPRERQGRESNTASIAAAGLCSPRIRSRRGPGDRLLRETPATGTHAPPACFLVNNSCSRYSLPAERSKTLSQDNSVVLPCGATRSAVADAMHAPSTRKSCGLLQRRLPSKQKEAHSQALPQPQQYFTRHRQRLQRAQEAAECKEKLRADLKAKTFAKVRPRGATAACERFFLDDCDALTEIAGEDFAA